jgi:hypothetical protein
MERFYTEVLSTAFSEGNWDYKWLFCIFVWFSQIFYIMYCLFKFLKII